ncbi:ComEC/Rec2 family competence protein [uncultured Arcanobacterium sp.]|uniref:ComEC/Rec2 family competence protein n=1 Tax=uncultured Arcanobacterium sp. TaxID=487520 RepID=UPI0026178665|nr:ComEC/Rec2 family competence protein [uncultured Arcanobacterium sp.]
MPNNVATESKFSAAGAESVFLLRNGEELLIEGKIRKTADRYCSYTLEAEQMHRAPHLQFFRKTSATLRSDFQKELQKNSLFYPALISGVVLGDDSQLEIQPQRALKKAGLAHLTAVSGAHISLLLGGVILLLGKSKPLLTAGAGTLILLQLLALVGLSPSVVRAALMGIWVLVALALERRGNSLPFLALSIMLTSLFFPEIARELGFQMSALATLSILTLGNYLQKNLAKLYPAAIARLLAYPLAAGVATMPLVSEIQDSLSLWTVAANLAAAPVVAPFTICGLAAVLGSSLPGFPVLPLLKICSFCASWIVKVAEFACQLPAGSLAVGKNLFLHILLVFFILASTRRKAAARGII